MTLRIALTPSKLRKASAALLAAADTLERDSECPTHKKAALAHVEIAEERIAEIRKANDDGGDDADDI